ncbi:MAG TPA: ABC transporter permease, partial [Gaiellaceae bacterium]|nr:ABC transporter permease [Gaiellaceae bacterium]
MSFSALVLRNLLRQRVRTVLTVLGIAVGITTVVALGSITEGVRTISGEFVRAGGADFMVAQEGAS